MLDAKLAAPARRLDLAPYDLAAALELERELGISHVLSQILVRRGFHDPEDVRELMKPSVRHDPLAFAGMESAVQAIRRHLDAGGRIVVHGDYDVDGICATAVLVRALRSLRAEPGPGWYLPSRSDDGYGLSIATVDRLARRGTDLLITVDCGITAVDEVAAARASGIEVVVTDHHSPRRDGVLPACEIIHPAIGGYPQPDLCGTAVAHKLAEALGAPTAEEDLELVALATVADLMPLHGENRRLVHDGLAQLAGTARPGLRALLAVSRCDPSGLDASCLGFRLAPRLNAAGRMRRADAALELLLTDDSRRAQEIAGELDLVNAERRAVEQRIGWEADALVEEMGERGAYVLAGQGWHGGVIGIVASRVVERYHRPAILIALDGSDPTLPAHGSGRSIPGFDLLAALDAAGAHLLSYGGHRAAAGLSVQPEQVDAFRDAIERHAEQVLTPELLEAVERVDAVVSGAELTLGLAEELLALEPCGNANPAATLLVTGARFADVRTMGEGKHARFTVSSGGACANAVSFRCDGQVPGSGGEVLDASFRLERNAWNGKIEPRLVLRHASACAPAPIVVLGEPDDYLTAVVTELERALPASPPAHNAGGDQQRLLLDRRGESPLAVLADARSASDEDGVLVVCADVPRRLAGLRDRAGGFALVSHAALADAPELLDRFDQVVVLDPPADEGADALVRRGYGYTHFSWGDAELRFAQQMHEQEYGLRASLVALYRTLRERQRVAGEELEHLLRGDDKHARSARLAGRLVRVFTELELVSLDRDLPALALAGAQPTQLGRSAAYRAYTKSYEEGQRFLSRARPRLSV